MATYAIGDVQGCFKTLQKLLDTIAFDRKRDRLWFAGDLINRGPGSLEALRFAYGHRDVVRMVLGNHELHFLGRVVGVRREGRRDTLDALMKANDRTELVDWLRAQPIAFEEAGHLVVHAGVLPSWSKAEVLDRADEVHAILTSEAWTALLASMWTKGKRLSRFERAARTISVCTLLRILDPDGEPAFEFKRALEDAPPGYRAWFEAQGRATANDTVVFGHWAALGHHLWQSVIALDSGCVWGNQLTAVRIEDHAVFQVDNAEERSRKRR